MEENANPDNPEFVDE